MKLNNNAMEKAVETGREKINKVLVVRENQGIGKRIREMVDECVEIDVR